MYHHRTVNIVALGDLTYLVYLCASPPDWHLGTISLAFEHLKNDVQRALNTQVEDVAWLDEQIAMCMNLERHIQYDQHVTIIAPDDRHIMLSSIHEMVADLEISKTSSTNEPDAPLVAHMRSVHTGGQGHPPIKIDTDVLATAYQPAGPTRLAQVFNVSARTI
ncbi:hypothetical protein EV424DRAFT_1354108 [Suillus variegatus]|nr:hypothetical protein EV424DRAFT_1354108 [Suillus variegatus]